jgi:hypothetical protein
MCLDPRTWFAAPSPPAIKTQCTSSLVTCVEAVVVLARRPTRPAALPPAHGEWCAD